MGSSNTVNKPRLLPLNGPDLGHRSRPSSFSDETGRRLDRQAGAVGGDDRPLEDLLQLPDIAGRVIPRELLDPRQRGTPLGTPKLAGGLGQEVVGRLRDVFYDFPEVPELCPLAGVRAPLE